VPKRISKSGQAARANERGIELHDEGDDAGALACYHEAIRLRPDWATPWYNIGLLHKYNGQWRESLEANLQAIRLEPSSEGAIWNAGIAATALGEWAQARSAWKQYGINIGEGDGPIDYPIGATPVRVACDGSPEVIWTRRIDPARAVIESVPLAASDRRYGDLLLHDGAPNGYRKHGTREVAVLDELQVLKPSAYSTFEVVVEGATSADLDDLYTCCKSVSVVMENWTETLHTLCKACSEGRPFAEGGHNHDKPARDDGSWRLGIAAMEADQARHTLEAWLGTRPGVKLSAFDCVLDANSKKGTNGASGTKNKGSAA
jgi:tetratricopeptide (TPR) repeat protein